MLNETLEGFDNYVENWEGTREKVCRDARFDETRSESEFQATSFCLERQRRRVGGFARSGAEDPSAMSWLPRVAQKLPRPESCVVTRGDDAAPLPSEGQRREEALTLSKSIAQADAAGVAGNFDEAYAGASAAYERAREIEDPLGQARAQRALLRVVLVRSEYERCEEHALLGMSAADRARAPEAWLDLAQFWITCLGRAGEIERAETVHAIAEARLRSATLGDRARASFDHGWGDALLDANRNVEARAILEGATKMVVDLYGSDNILTAGYYNSLGNALIRNPDPDFDRAAEYYDRALELWSRYYGPDHENVAHAHNNVAIVHVARGRYSEARASLRRTLDIYSRVFGPEHLMLSNPYLNLSDLALTMGEFEESARLSQVAVGIEKNSRGEMSPGLLGPLTNLAEAQDGLGRRDEAIATCLLAETIAVEHGRLGFVRELQLRRATSLVRAGRVGAGKELAARVPAGDTIVPATRDRLAATLALEEGDADTALRVARSMLSSSTPGGHERLEADTRW
jgi:tetratricopeptide (TPR) repeat protein